MATVGVVADDDARGAARARRSPADQEQLVQKRRKLAQAHAESQTALANARADGNDGQARAITAQLLTLKRAFRTLGGDSARDLRPAAKRSKATRKRHQRAREKVRATAASASALAMGHNLVDWRTEDQQREDAIEDAEIALSEAGPLVDPNAPRACSVWHAGKEYPLTLPALSAATIIHLLQRRLPGRGKGAPPTRANHEFLRRLRATLQDRPAILLDAKKILTLITETH